MSHAPVAQTRKKRSAGPFSATLVIWLILIGVVAFIGVLVMAAFGSEWQSGDDGRGHALSHSAIGFAGVVELLRGTGTEVEISRTDHPVGGSLLVVTPPSWTSAEAMKKLEFSGPRLIVLPKWSPGPWLQGWVRGRDTLKGKESLDPVNGKDGKAVLEIHRGYQARHLQFADGSPFAVTGKISDLRTISGDGWIPVIVASDGGAVLARRGAVWLLADPDLIDTFSLSDRETAKAGLKLVHIARAGGDPVIFDVSLHGIKKERNLLQLVFEPPFLGVTLALGLAVLLLALQAVGRFGPPIQRGRAIALGKQGLADNSAALIRLARREHRMVERYALYARGEAARAVGAPHALPDAELEALLDRLSVQQNLTPFTQLRAEAASAKDLATALTAARRLYSWRLEMTRERH